MEPLVFDQILYNEPIYWLEQKWQRELVLFIQMYEM
jgi:hypothetical protein